MDAGESYGELGGQLPDESQRERGLRKVAEARERLKAAKRCEVCGELLATHPETCESDAQVERMETP